MALPTKRMPTVMQQGYSFAQVPAVRTDRSVFDRSHGYKTTFDAGLLVPVFVDYVMPGDTCSCRMTALARLTTPFKPLMDNLYLESFFFFIPFRLVWLNFVKFMGEQVNPGDSISFTVPQTGSPATGWILGSLADYMGLPTVGTPAVTAQINVSALPCRAFWLVYNQWFRDQNLISSQNAEGGTGPVVTDDGPDATAGFNVVPPKRGKRHDYFTSCLTSLQKGVAVSLPLGSQAPVKATAAGDPHVFSVQSSAGAYWTSQVTAVNTDARIGLFGAAGSSSNRLYADLAGATAATINDLRLSLMTQMFLERDARSGTRYTEIVRGHYGVESDDARLQRAEYLGGGSTPVMISPIAQTTQTGLTGGNTPIGNLSGVGAALVSQHGFHKSFTEHGILLGIVNVRADLTYSQGVERFWSYSTRFDFPWPDFAHLGEQAVLNKEIYATGAAADALVFGYQERYAEARYKPSKVTGLFRPTAAGTLELWHLSEKFSALPTLGQTFIEDQTETILDTRLAVPSEPDFLFDAWFDYKCARPLPVFSVPGLGSRF